MAVNKEKLEELMKKGDIEYTIKDGHVTNATYTFIDNRKTYIDVIEGRDGYKRILCYGAYNTMIFGNGMNFYLDEIAKLDLDLSNAIESCEYGRELTDIEKCLYVFYSLIIKNCFDK